MKTRVGFVSNSSSSSFIVINNNKETTNKEIERLHQSFIDSTLVVDKSFGDYEFGWGYEKYRDLGSKIIFSYLQARDNPDEEKKKLWTLMLEKVLKDKLGIIDICWDLKEEGYIDHQSASWEGMNTEMFDSEENLINFIFNPSSFIQTDNDNH